MSYHQLSHTGQSMTYCMYILFKIMENQIILTTTVPRTMFQNKGFVIKNKVYYFGGQILQDINLSYLSSIKNFVKL